MAENDARIDRTATLAAMWAASRGSQADRVRLMTLCAAAGSRYANAKRSLASLIADIDDLERAVLDKLAESGESAVADAMQVHACCSRMRAAAIAGFGHAAASAVNRRVRTARHGIINNLGTVRNAILLMDDEPDPTMREHFREIAKRNSVTSEHLVRSHLNEGVADQGGFAASAADAAALIGPELSSCADRAPGPETVAALQELASLIGVTLASEKNSLTLRLSGSLRGNQRHDLGRARERDHPDTVGL